MDISTVIGILLGTVLIINGIQISNLGNFYDLPSVIIVIGGTLAGLIASFPLSAFKKIPKHNRPLSEERGHTKSFTFDEAWEKEVTVTKAGKKNQIKW